MFAISKRPTIREIHDLYRAGKATPSQVFAFFLNRSKVSDKKLNTVQTYTEALGSEQAARCDTLLSEADDFDSLIREYPLFGIPYSLKAIIQAEGQEFTASSKILDGFKSPYSSTVYTKVEKAGAVLVSVSHMDEFAMGSSGESSAYGPTRNPYDISRVPGGSSSGPVAAVASGQVVFSLGTDTGGSIRQPAAFCGVVGLKPTYGAVSRFGVMPMASSFDQVGPITQTIEDSQIVFSVIAGKDQRDQTSIDSKETIDSIIKNLTAETTRTTKGIKSTKNKLKIGIPKEFYAEGLDPQIKESMLTLEARLSEIGHELVQVSLPLLKQAIPVYYMTMGVEVASNLERFDGVRYRGDNEYDAKEAMYFDYRSSYFGKEAQRRILLGTYASAAGYYDAYYNKAHQVKELTRQSFLEVFKHVDVLLTPTTPEFAFKIGSKSEDPVTMYLSDIYTAVVNPVRLPGLVIPLRLFDVEVEKDTQEVVVEPVEKEFEVSDDFVDEEVMEVEDQSNSTTVSLPTGCQLIGPELSEDVLYKLGGEIEQIVAEK
jgi:aspartyl-tRNA(Asn)/glutamyl-tRNA(Gln) amidotransferase subunit A